MNYTETINYLFTKLPVYQRNGPAAYKNSLDNTLKLDDYYGNPHRKFKSVHVAGTNGKGSVAHMLASVLQSAGYKTGLYTSPHLKDFRERIRINGKMIPKKEVIKWVENYGINNKLWKIEPSFFELTVALAFDYFANKKTDIAIVEVGLGGRLDSTNIILPAVSIITNIGLDHTDLLGDTLEKIAAEKAGIIKHETPVVIGITQKETKTVFEEFAKLKNAPISFADKEILVAYSLLGTDGKRIVTIEKNGKKVYPGLQLDLVGNYQLKNLPAVLKSLEILGEKGCEVSDKNIYDGLNEVVKKTGLLGRWQIIGNNPLIVCDTGHNEDGIKAIVKQINNIPFKKLHIVFGTVRDKNPEKVLKCLPQNAVYYFTRANIPRAMNEDVLAKEAEQFGLKGKTFKTVKEALENAKFNAGKNDLIWVGGSTFVVADIL